MNAHRTALLLIGSPRGTRSTSNSLGSYLLDRLKEKGWRIESLDLCRTLAKEGGPDAMLSEVSIADLVVLSFPVYADSLPSIATKALETMTRRKTGKLPPRALTVLRQVLSLLEQHNLPLALALLRRVTLFLPMYIRWTLLAVLGQVLEKQKVSDQAISRLKNYLDKLEPKSQSFMAISNSGFPEAKQSSTAISICRQFASEAGWKWAGGLALGAGPCIDGKPLSECGRMVKNVKKALDIAADDLTADRPVSDRAVRLMAKPLRASWLYMLLGNLGWRLKMGRNRRRGDQGECVAS